MDLDGCVGGLVCGAQSHRGDVPYFDETAKGTFREHNNLLMVRNAGQYPEAVDRAWIFWTVAHIRPETAAMAVAHTNQGQTELIFDPR